MDCSDIQYLRKKFGDQQVFHYYPDKFALILLREYCRRPRTVGEIKKSRFAGLLRRPLLKELTAQQGVISRDLIDALPDWRQDTQVYRLTLGQWGTDKSSEKGYHQISRLGHNIVLQLNFGAGHNGLYNKLKSNYGYHPYRNESHPVQTGEKMHTLAWARMDWDTESGDVLIEEIQNDWLRSAVDDLEYYRDSLENYRSAPDDEFEKEDRERMRLIESYIRRGLAPHIKTWAEAMLGAAIRYARWELGATRIFYHTMKSGSILKVQARPPRFIYDKLPRSFCFRKTEERPHFIQQEMKPIRKRVFKHLGRRKRKKAEKQLAAQNRSRVYDQRFFYLLEFT